jgi:hypothetical protein
MSVSNNTFRNTSDALYYTIPPTQRLHCIIAKDRFSCLPIIARDMLITTPESRLPPQLETYMSAMQRGRTQIKALRSKVDSIVRRECAM